MKRILYLILALALLLITGCSAKDSETETDPNEPRNEAQIAKDIANNKFFKDEYPRFGVTGVSIVKRQTDEANKSDKVYVTAHLINDKEDGFCEKANTIEGDVSLLVTYGLYNSGWVLDTCEVDSGGDYESGKFKPLASIELDEHQIGILLGLGNHTSIEIEDSSCELDYVSYSVNALTKYKYADEIISFGVVLEFISDGGYWASSSSHSWPEYDWHLSGDYYFGENNKYHEYIPYDQPQEIMNNLDDLSIISESGTVYKAKFVDLDTITRKDLCTLIDPYSIDFILDEGYSPAFWDGENKETAAGFNYSDFDYVFVRRPNEDYCLLFGIDRIAYTYPSFSPDHINQILYFEIHDVTPILD